MSRLTLHMTLNLDSLLSLFCLLLQAINSNEIASTKKISKDKKKGVLPFRGLHHFLHQYFLTEHAQIRNTFYHNYTNSIKTSIAASPLRGPILTIRV